MASMSGITVADAVAKYFGNFQKRKNKRMWFMMKFNEDQSQVILAEKSGKYADLKADAAGMWDTMKEKMPEDEARYGCCKVPFVARDGRDLDLILFFMWSPAGGASRKLVVTRNMLCTTTKDAVTAVCTCKKSFEWREDSDCDLAEIQNDLSLE